MAATPNFPGAGHTLKVSVTVDQRTGTKTLCFSRPVTVAEASGHLFGNPGRSALLKPAGAISAGRATLFILEVRDVATIMQIRAEVRDQLLQGSVIGSSGPPAQLPPWVPPQIRQDIQGGKLARGATRYKGQPPWGDIVVWKDNVSIQVYQEFPDSPSFYAALGADAKQARLLHYAYTQYNKDMADLVDGRGLSPEYARSEIRRINDEVFKLILEGAVAVLNSGVGVAQVNNAIRSSASELSNAARRSPRFTAALGPDEEAMIRLAKTQDNLLGKSVVRTSSTLTKPTRFRHTLTADVVESSYVQIEKSSKINLASGSKAHYGEGVYAWGEGAKQVKKYIDIEVAAGTAVEKIEVNGQVFYRILPPRGNTLQVKIVGTKLSQQEIALGRRMVGL